MRNRERGDWRFSLFSRKLHSADIPPPLRAHTRSIDGVLHTQTFPHGDLQGDGIDPELNRRFHDWLEITAPGAHEDDKVTGIRFADMTE